MRTGGQVPWDWLVKFTRFRMNQATATAKLKGMGLPHLEDRNGDALGFFLDFVVDGVDLDEARVASGLSHRRVGSVLRVLATPFVGIMREMGHLQIQCLQNASALTP